MGKHDRIARGLLRPINPYSTLILGIFTTCWGLWMLSPWWSVFAQSSAYVKMEQFAPEWAWGCWSVIAGALVILAVFKGLYRWLSFALGFISWHWATVSLMLWLGDWQNIGGLTYMGIAVFSSYVYLNIKVNYVKFGEDIPSFYV